MIVSPVIGLELATVYDTSYLSTQMFCGFMYLGSALLMWILRSLKLLEMQRSVTIQSNTAGNYIPGQTAGQHERLTVLTANYAKVLRQMGRA